MPLYDYLCRDCQHVFEELVQGDEVVVCPACQGSAVERLLSVPAKPQVRGTPLPLGCSGEGPPCGAPWCQRK